MSTKKRKSHARANTKLLTTYERNSIRQLARSKRVSVAEHQRTQRWYVGIARHLVAWRNFEQAIESLCNSHDRQRRLHPDSAALVATEVARANRAIRVLRERIITPR